MVLHEIITLIEITITKIISEKDKIINAIYVDNNTYETRIKEYNDNIETINNKLNKYRSIVKNK